MARKNPSPRLIAWRTREFVNLALTHLQALYGVEFVIVPIDDITAVNSMRRMVTIGDKYAVQWMFTPKAECGRKIVEILGGHNA